MENFKRKTKYFYKPVELRALDAIMAEIPELERSTEGMLKEILGDAVR